MSGTPGPGDDFWYNPVSSGGNAGVPVNHATALQSSVVFACVKVISGSIGALPLKVYRRRENGDKIELPEHPLFELLHDQTNEEHTAQEFRETMTAHALLRGTAFAEIIPGSRGAVDQLIPIHPDEVMPKTFADASGRTMTQFEIRKNGEPVRRLLRNELFIYRALVLGKDGVLGIDPIMAEANAIGARLASQEYGARFFQNDAQAGLLLKHPNHFKSKEDRDRFMEGWQMQSTGANRHKTRVLEFGMDTETISMTNEQSQFLETQKYQDLDIARIFNVQPHKIAITDQMTFTNVEAQNIEFVSDTLMPWAVRWHQGIKRDLIRQRSVFAEHNFASLLRGDTEARFRAHAIARNWGWASANDIRRKENENSIGPEGDIYLQPLNMSLAGEPAEPSGIGREPSEQPRQAAIAPKNGADNGKTVAEH
jgi:HK97 family phage portal protein